LQKEKFKERISELESGKNSILKLIRSLDQKKEKALHTTIKMVAHHFAEVFNTIVPDCEGKIIMKTDDKQEVTGIGFEVRFEVGGSIISEMNELSGGQKTVVALSIIFAIQRCDPAPFYLFDEVDANLDPMYRGAVANMISQQKQEKDGPNSNCQFVTSSFHEELVKAADNHWLVSFSGMSRMNKGSLDSQLKILRKNVTDRESKI